MDADCSLIPTLGLRFKVSKYYDYFIMPTINAGISVIFSDTTADRSASDDLQKKMAFSFSTGIVFGFDVCEVGFFTGVDFLAGDLGLDWEYQGKLWFGAAIGVTLFGEVGLMSKAN